MASPLHVKCRTVSTFVCSAPSVPKVNGIGLPAGIDRAAILADAGRVDRGAQAPQPLTEPYVKLSLHTALIIRLGLFFQ